MFGKVIVLDKYPESYKDILDIFFQGKKSLILADKYEEDRTFKIDLVKWARIVYNELFKGKKSLTEEEMVKLVKSVYFKERPLYRKFFKDGYINWDAFFKAEDKSARNVVKKFMDKNKDKIFIHVNYNNMWKYDIYHWGSDDMRFDKCIEKFNFLGIGDYKIS